MLLELNETIKQLIQQDMNNKIIRIVIDTTNNHYEGNLLIPNHSIDMIDDDCIVITESKTHNYFGLVKTIILKSSIIAFSYRIDNIIEK